MKENLNNFYPLPQYDENTIIKEADPHNIRQIIEESLSKGINIPFTIAQNLFGFTGWNEQRSQRFLSLLEKYNSGTLDTASTLVNFYYENLPLFESGVAPFIENDNDTQEVINQFIKKQHPAISQYEKLNGQNMHAAIYSILFCFNKHHYITGLGYPLIITEGGATTLTNPNFEGYKHKEKLMQNQKAVHRVATINSNILVFMSCYANEHKITKISTLINSLFFLANYASSEWQNLLNEANELPDETLSYYNTTTIAPEDTAYFLDKLFNLNFVDRLHNIKVQQFKGEENQFLFLNKFPQNILNPQLISGQNIKLFNDRVEATNQGFIDLSRGKVSF